VKARADFRTAGGQCSRGLLLGGNYLGWDQEGLLAQGAGDLKDLQGLRYVIENISQMDWAGKIRFPVAVFSAEKYSRTIPASL
jgi:hypothetical protein